MKKLARKLALGLAAVLLAGSLSACSGTGNGIAKYGNEEIAAEEAEFWLRYEQWTTEAYYWDLYVSLMGADNMWNTTYTETQTMGEYMHESVMAQIQQTRILIDHMADYGVGELTEDQKAKAKETVDSFLEAYPLFTEHVSATTEQMYSYMETNAKASLVAQAIKDAAGITVEESEYAKYGIMSVKVTEPGEDEETEETEEPALEGEELAKAILAEVQAGGDISEVAESHELTAYSGSYLVNGDTSEDVRYTASAEMKVGDAALVETDGGWYVVTRTTDLDEEASETQKQNVIAEKEENAFNEAYAEILKTAKKFTVDETQWGKYTIDSKIYEEPETEAAETEAAETEAAE